MLRRYLPVIFPILVLVFGYIYYFNVAKKPLNQKLTIYTYGSFASSWGPGPELQKLFQLQTNTRVEIVDAGEAGVIIQRILLEANKTPADVVIGLDQYQISDSTRELFEGELEAFNWAPMAFIYRKSDKNILPARLEDFLNTEFKGKIILLDPRASAPGYIFFHWLVQNYGLDGAKKFINDIRKHVYTVAPSWSAGYGLFKKGLAQYIFSYATSPVYHWVEEKNFDYQALALTNRMPVHREFAGVLKTSKNKELAQTFLSFLQTEEAQKIIMNKNYMLPTRPNVTEGTPFENVAHIETDEPKFDISREQVLEAWSEIKW